MNCGILKIFLRDCKGGELAEFELERMAAANPEKVLPRLLNKCVNCMAFAWGQPEELTTLRKCKQCKMVQYCSESCQKEHWKLVHKQHCKKIATIIASYQEIGDDFGVSEVITSHHPFPASELPSDPVEALMMLAQKILSKMQFRNNAAYTRVSGQLAQLQEEMAEWMWLSWAYKKIFPEKIHCKNNPGDLNRILALNHETSRTVNKELVSQDLWSTLHLVLGRLYGCEAVNLVNSLKDPRAAVPPELWVGFQQEVGPFPSRVAELIKALSGDQFPSFQELLKIFCGGNLRQACSVCSVRIDVAAVAGEVEGCYEGIHTVSIYPFLPPLFFCGAKTCIVEDERKEDAFAQLQLGLGATRTRLRSTRCDYCFLLAEKVHRYNDKTGHPASGISICHFPASLETTKN